VPDLPTHPTLEALPNKANPAPTAASETPAAPALEALPNKANPAANWEAESYQITCDGASHPEACAGGRSGRRGRSPGRSGPRRTPLDRGRTSRGRRPGMTTERERDRTPIGRRWVAGVPSARRDDGRACRRTFPIPGGTTFLATSFRAIMGAVCLEHNLAWGIDRGRPWSETTKGTVSFCPGAG
jgi:hypothetical protein